MALPINNHHIGSSDEQESPLQELSDLGNDHIGLMPPLGAELKKAPASVKLLDPEMQAVEDERAAARTASIEDKNEINIASSRSSSMPGDDLLEKKQFTKKIID